MHIGDTRTYLLRGGELFQLTQDHTWSRPRSTPGNSTATRPPATPSGPGWSAPSAGARVEADLALRTAVTADRCLLCSDGLSAVVDRAALQAALSASADPEETVASLIRLAHAHGAPDNIACVVATSPRRRPGVRPRTNPMPSTCIRFSGDT